MPVVTDDSTFDARQHRDGRCDTLALYVSLPGTASASTADASPLHAMAPQPRHRPHHRAPRPISEEKPVEGSIEFTQDLPTLRAHWNTGLEHIAERKTEPLRRDQARVGGWAGRCSLRGAGAALARAGRATDLFGRGFEETKEKYDVPRSTEPLEEIEQRRRRSPGVCV
jgi:hypothetical protein